MVMAMTLRLTEQQDAQLDSWAAIEGISKQKLVLTAVDEYLERHAHSAKYDAAFDRVMSRHAGLIERLSET
jgi:hypothetical protein